MEKDTQGHSVQFQNKLNSSTFEYAHKIKGSKLGSERRTHDAWRPPPPETEGWKWREGRATFWGRREQDSHLISTDAFFVIHLQI